MWLNQVTSVRGTMVRLHNTRRESWGNSPHRGPFSVFFRNSEKHEIKNLQNKFATVLKAVLFVFLYFLWGEFFLRSGDNPDPRALSRVAPLVLPYRKQRRAQCVA